MMEYKDIHLQEILCGRRDPGRVGIAIIVYRPRKAHTWRRQRDGLIWARVDCWGEVR